MDIPANSLQMLNDVSFFLHLGSKNYSPRHSLVLASILEATSNLSQADSVPLLSTANNLSELPILLQDNPAPWHTASMSSACPLSAVETGAMRKVIDRDKPWQNLQGGRVRNLLPRRGWLDPEQVELLTSSSLRSHLASHASHRDHSNGPRLRRILLKQEPERYFVLKGRVYEIWIEFSCDWHDEITECCKVLWITDFIIWMVRGEKQEITWSVTLFIPCYVDILSYPGARSYAIWRSSKGI
jgi:hypothetical protein